MKRILYSIVFLFITAVVKGQNCYLFERRIKSVNSFVGCEEIYAFFVLEQNTLFYGKWYGYKKQPVILDTIKLSKNNLEKYSFVDTLNGFTTPVKIKMKRNKLIVYERINNKWRVKRNKLLKVREIYKIYKKPLYKRHSKFNKLLEILCK